MADRDYAEYGVPQAYGPGRAQRLVQLAGAASSVALVLALGVWGYKLAVRDIAGVPVIRAIEGPLRVAPADPGGEQADHQGLAVNDVAAEGGAAPTADRLVLAPKPVELTLEDTAGLTDPLATEVALQPAALATVTEAEPAVAEPEEDPVAAALSAALDTEVEAVALDEDGSPPPEGAITRSLRPLPRPERPETTVAATPSAPTEIDPKALEVGTRLVQFGAYDSEAEAKAEWMRLAGRFGDLMIGKAMVIQPAQSGGKTFFRLRAHGFEGEDEARRFCSAVVAENASCIPVAHR